MTAAIIAHEQNTSTGLLYSILIDGLDVAGQVPYDTIRVTEAGPGAVSSMSFTIKDPTKRVTIQDSAYVQSWDYTRDLPVFAGFVQTQEPIPGYGGSGRDIDVTCYGIESLLDQIIVPEYTTRVTDTDSAGAVPVEGHTFLQSVAAYAPLRAFSTTLPSAGSQALPIATDGVVALADLVVDGMTIRNAFQAFAEKTWPIAFNFALTVDMWGGIRKYIYPPIPSGIGWPTDYVDLTIVETTGGTAAASLRWTRDSSPGQVITAVYVNGGNAAGTGWVVGDTTQGRGEAYVADASITTADLKNAAGNAVLRQRGTGAGRGTLTIENYTPIAGVHAGGPLVITNAALGWTANDFAISQIDKTFNKTGTQNWTVTFFDVLGAPVAGRAHISRRLRSFTRSLQS